MAKLLDDLFRLTAGMAEASLFVTDSTLRFMQSAADKIVGRETPYYPAAPPVEGPQTLDLATADLANRLGWILWTTPLEARELPWMLQGAITSVQRSFAGLDWSDPKRWLTLPFDLPLSLATLLTEQGLRALHTAGVVGPEKFLPFAAYMTDSFADIHVFVSLQYKEYSDYLRDRVRRVPDDARSRLKLGKVYTKLGRYKEAVYELEIAARTAESRAEALHERLVANYRAGWFGEALQDGAKSLALNPANDRTRYWTWLAAQRSGGYPVGFPEALRAEVQSGRHRPSVELEDVAPQMGLDKIGANRGTAVFDMDGNGYLDVILSSNHGGINVYRNNGDGTFTEVTQGSGLEREIETFGVAIGDYNNDGLDDVFITRLGFYVGHSKLYRNNGDGTFTDVTAEAGVGFWGPQFTAQWVDYDCDGNLDLFVCCNIGSVFDRKTPNLLFHNNSDGTFTEVSRQAGLCTISPTIGTAWGDYDNDGYPDLFLSNGIGRAQLFHNNGDGTFTDVSREAGVDVLAFGGVSLWCDYDNDGWLDIVQFVWSPEPDVLYTLFHGDGPPDGRPMRIFHNNRNGTFTIKNRELGLTGCWGTMSGNVGDYNNDGNLDLMLGNGDPHMDHTQPAILLEGDSTGQFKDVTFAAGLPYTGKGHGVNMADLNGDGRLCLILATGGAYPADLLPTSVFRPKTLPGHYLNVRLVGTKSNRNAVGARVTLLAGGRTQHRLVSGGTGFGYLPYEQHFGLGSLCEADLLEILWPSGTRQSMERPPINTTIRIIEGKAGWEEVYKKSHL